MPSPERGIILAATEGKRLKPLTEFVPKTLLPLDRKPIIFHSIELFEHLGVKDVVITVEPKFGRKVQSTIERGYTGNINIDFVVQETHNGIGFAILMCQDRIGDNSFFVRFADEYQPGVKALQPDDFARDNAVLVVRREHHPEYLLQNTNVEVDEDARKVIGVSRNKNAMPRSNYHLCGLMTFPPVFFDILEKFKNRTDLYQNGEFSTVHGIQHLIDSGNSVGYSECKGFYVNINTFKDLLRAYRYSLFEQK